LNEEIVELTILQAIDHQIDGIDGEIQEQQAALDGKSSDLADRETTIAALTEKIETLEKERRTLEVEVADEMVHVKERQSKMMQVQTGREQTALLKEIEDGKKGVKEKEEKTVAIMEEVERLTAEIEENKNLFKGETKLLAEETEAVKEAIIAINKRKKTQINKRVKQAKKLTAKLMRKYDTLRMHRNGLGVVNVLDGVCQGCFMAIPPQQYNLLLRGEKALDCPTCQRIMYHEPIEGTGAGETKVSRMMDDDDDDYDVDVDVEDEAEV
jgi:predicted  nucleic acid-binding Zn-ribbon protein